MLQALKPWFEDVSQTQMTSLEVGGGLSGAAIWHVDVGDRQFCLRRWPQSHPPLAGLLEIHGLLQHVTKQGLEIVPTPIATRDGKSYVQHDDNLWELTPWLPGKPSLASEPSVDKLSAAMLVLAEFHQVAQCYAVSDKSACIAPSPGLRQRLTILQKLQQGELEWFWNAAKAAKHSASRQLALQMLEPLQNSLAYVLARLEPLVGMPLPLQWCLRDVRCDHFLFTEEQVSGLLDFGAVAVDSVAGDLARLLGSLAHNQQYENWQLGIAAYEQLRPLSAVERHAVVGFDEGGLLCSVANWIRWLFVEERSFPNMQAVEAQLLNLHDRLRLLARRACS